MADKPILFSAPMVRALLDGTKTQTRRVIKNAPGDGWHMDRVGPTGFQWTCEGGMPRMPFTPPLAVGDRLWVREAHYLTDDGTSEHAVFAAESDDVAAHLQEIEDLSLRHSQVDWSKHTRLRPSIFLPRWASRLTLAVTEVRVARLQSICPGDAEAEGIEHYGGIDADCHGWRDYMDPDRNPRRWIPARDSFASLWNSINGTGAWEANPWVCAYTFTVQHGNIDQLEAAA